MFALHRGNTLEELQIRGQDLSGQHMVRQNIDKLVLVFRLEQAVQSSFGESTKGFICWCKDGERTWRAEGFDKISCDNCRHQSGEIIHRLSQFNNVRLRIAERGWRQKNAINNVCNAIACQVVCTNHRLELSDTGSNINSLAGLHHVNILALDCGNTLEELQICGQNLGWQHVVSQNVNKLVLILRLEQCVQSSFRESTEGLIGGSKHGEGTWRAECFGKISCNNCRNQSGEIIHRLSQFNDVWLGIAQRRWRQKNAINDVRHTIACQVVCTNNCLELFDTGSNINTLVCPPC